MVRVKDAELQKLRQQVKNLENSLERTTEVSASHCHCNLLLSELDEKVFGFQSKSLNKQLNTWNKKKLILTYLALPIFVLTRCFTSTEHDIWWLSLKEKGFVYSPFWRLYTWELTSTLMIYNWKVYFLYNSQACYVCTGVLILFWWLLKLIFFRFYDNRSRDTQWPSICNVWRRTRKSRQS